jgi:AcrR family transcriptional regulator
MPSSTEKRLPVAPNKKKRTDTPVATDATASAVERRERRKAVTRGAIFEAALNLFASQGYDATTMGDIAIQAGVSQRTVFHYFPTKEDIIFTTPPGEIVLFQELIEAQPDDLSDLDVIVESLVAWYNREGLPEASVRAMTKLLVRAAASSPVLLGKQVQFSEGLASAAALALGRRRGESPPSPATQRLTQVCMWACHYIVQDWVETPRGSLSELTRRRFDEIRRLFADPTRV